MLLSKSKAIIIISLLLISQLSESASLQDGFVAYKQGDVEVAQKNWLPLAIQGDVRAQFFLSELFEKMSQSSTDKNNAKRWLTASANNGFVPAQFNLGNNYHKGKYGSVNNKMAEHWWSQAAVQGFPEAQFRIAALYYWGKDGVKQNLKEAFYWFEQAANAGHKDAREAVLLMRGGEELSPVEANRFPNITYDDPRIVSKLSLDSKQMSIMKSQNMHGAAETKQQPIMAIKSKVVAQQNWSDKIESSAPKEPEKSVNKIGHDELEQSGNKWVMQQPQVNYTIQLLASTNLLDCKIKIKQIHERYKLALHSQSFTKKSKKYCAVIHGSYRSYSKAKAGLKQLPRKLRQGNPWIRKIAR
jgi:TPR repeat protein